MFSLADVSARLDNKSVSSVEITQAMLARIEQFNPTLNAFTHVAADAALAQARAADARRARGERVTPLTGVPLSIKDVMHVPGMPTTCASTMLKNFHPPFAATAVQRLLDAGAVLVGKTNMDEFAMGASTEHSAYGPTRNPWNPAYAPGGSSGGSAAAVAAGLCAGSLGSDTGGSVRQPAALTATVGLKPTYGRVSRYGLVAFASSLDQIGPFGARVSDAALLLHAIAGHDPLDSTSADLPVPEYAATLNDSIRGLKIGVPKEYFGEGLQDDVRAATLAALETLRSAGAEIVEISLPHTRYAVPCYYIIAPAEASANLARYDGVRFGHRSAKAATLHELYTNSRREGFGGEVTRRILLGTFVLSAGYYDAYYGQAQRVRALIQRDFADAFTTVDVICTPTTPSTAFKLGEKIADPVQMYLADICTVSCNLAGLPGISVPCGFSRAELPIGLQIIGRHFDEATMLRVAATFERATEWHTKVPQL